ncbi:MAG TPA: TIGR01777 family protein, partial [Acinetobacter radioresistens]|nr:TIGR01777 family protein [Acinetobacter radioresistens]
QVSIIRLGVVFARNGGILPQMLMPIRFNLVGKIGHGLQPVTWIHINDVVRAITFILQQ